MASQKYNDIQRCKLAVENGMYFLYMPDGTKIPEQLDCRVEVEQTLENATYQKPALTKVTITLYAELLDTLKPNIVTVVSRNGEEKMIINHEPLIEEIFEPSMATGFFYGDEYYPKDELPEGRFDARYGIFTMWGPQLVKPGDILKKDKYGNICNKIESVNP